MTFRAYSAGAVSDVAGPAGLPVNAGYPAYQGSSTYAGITGLLLGISGTTAARPAANNVPAPQFKGLRYFDTTLNILLIHDGYFWRNPVTGQMV